MTSAFDSLLVVSFGGPEGPDDVMPFLENVARGRNVPRERLLEVAEHYLEFGGISPINRQNRDLVAALEQALAAREVALPIFLGNRNWHPYLEDTLREMGRAGHRSALALFTSAYSSYSSCRQYREDIARARAAIGEGAPEVQKIRPFFNHPGFVEANAARIHQVCRGEALQEMSVVFTAHSIPLSMARASRYEEQLLETCRLVADAAGLANWTLAYQSRSGPPQVPWLGPDILDVLEVLAGAGARAVIVHPVGFLSDHMEVIFDLDVEARERSKALGLDFTRSAAVGTHPAFVEALCDLVLERLDPKRPRQAIGRLPAAADACAPGCCLPETGGV